MSLRLSRDEIGRIRQHTEKSSPFECCGVLVARRGVVEAEVEPIRVEDAIPLQNVSPDPRCRFEIDPQDLLEAHLEARATGREIIGYYHSHPRGPAVPSEVDRLAAWPEASYLICGGGIPGGSESSSSVRSWRLVEGRFVEEEVEILANASGEAAA